MVSESRRKALPKARFAPVLIDMPVDGVLAGESFRVGIEVGQLQGWVVPRGAINRDKKGDFVWQLDANLKGKLPDGREYDGKAQRVNIDIIGQTGKVTIFDGKIDIEKPIIITGGTQLTDNNSPVRVDTGVPVDEDEDEP